MKGLPCKCENADLHTHVRAEHSGVYLEPQNLAEGWDRQMLGLSGRQVLMKWHGGFSERPCLKKIPWMVIQEGLMLNCGFYRHVHRCAHTRLSGIPMCVSITLDPFIDVNLMSLLLLFHLVDAPFYSPTIAGD